MVQRYLYDYGLPFSESLKYTLNFINERVELQKASMILIDGGLGEGKTTLGQEIGEYYDKDNFNIWKQYGQGGEAFLKSAQWCSEHDKRTVLYDEAGDFSRRSALTKFNKDLITFFEKFRAFKLIPILMLPKFWVLDNHLLNLEVPRILIHLCGRSKHQGSFNVYDIQGMYYLKENVRKMVVKPLVYNTVQPIMRGHFLPLTPEKQKILDAISMKGKKESILKLINMQGNLISLSGLSLKLKCSTKTVENLIKKHGIEPMSTVNRRHYYDSSLVKQLKR